MFAGGPLTTAVGAEAAPFDPPAFVAVTITTSVLPMSAACWTYVLHVWPAMLRQLFPALSQRRHW